jgi:AcrR family transcriptional regulator
MEQGLAEMMLTMRYEDITVSDMCEKLQIPRKSFYRYFASKEDALYAMIDHTLMSYEEFGKMKRQTAKRTLQSDLAQFFQFWLENKKILDALQKSGLGGVLIERSIEYAVSEDVFPKRFLPGETFQVRRHVVMFAVCGLMSMMLQWYQNGCKESVQTLAEIAKRLLNQPLFPAAEEKML